MRTSKITAPKKRPVETRKPLGYTIPAIAYTLPGGQRSAARKTDMIHARCLRARREFLVLNGFPAPEVISAWYKWPKGARCVYCSRVSDLTKPRKP